VVAPHAAHSPAHGRHEETTVRGGHIIVGRVGAAGPDPRFRMTLLKGDTYGLSLYHRKKWEPLPFQAPSPNWFRS